MLSIDIPFTGGIYQITCVTTGRFYIGSAKDLHNRHRQHFGDLQRGSHSNQKLQRAFNKYGIEAFTFTVLEYVLVPEMLTAREQFFFKKLNPFGPKGFNIAVTAGSQLGMKASPETIEKLRISHLGQPGYWTGKKRDPETTEKISAKKRGKPSPRKPGYTHSPEHREKIRLARLGTKATPEARANMGKAGKGRVHSLESIERTRLANTGRKNTPEAIAGMVDAHASVMKTIIVTDPNGVEYSVQGIRPFCREHGLDRRCLQRVLQGKAKQHKGWRARYLEADAN
jgi:group I intron endonuclease